MENSKTTNSPKLLYHYCTLETFEKILEGKKIKFSDITKSNDYNELTFTWKKYLEYRSKGKLSDIKNTSLKYAIDSQLHNTLFLTLCFTYESDFLHMWCCYANGGVALGFSEEKLKEWMQGVRYFKDNKTCCDFRKVDYFDLDNLGKQIEIDCIQNDLLNNSCDNCINDEFYKIFKEAPFRKNEFFQCEREVRSVIPVFRDNEFTNILECSICDEKNQIHIFGLEEGENKYSSEVSYCLIPISKNLISEIIIGPNCSIDEKTIIEKLKSNGFDSDCIKIKKSRGSYR